VTKANKELKPGNWISADEITSPEVLAEIRKAVLAAGGYPSNVLGQWETKVSGTTNFKCLYLDEEMDLLWSAFNKNPQNRVYVKDIIDWTEQPRCKVTSNEHKMVAHDFLGQAVKEMEDRAKTYDKPEGERSMAATVAAFKAVTGDGVMNTEERGWLFMQLLKAVRSQQGDYRADNYVDGSAYAGLAGEAASKERGGV
jgi:hypothetical protein